MNKSRDADELHATAGVVLRPEAVADASFLRAVYASAREEELDRTGWSGAERQQFLDQQFRAMCVGYREAFPHAEFAIVLLDGTPVGRLVVQRSACEVRVVDLAILPAYRNRGIGRLLLERLCAEAAAAGKPVRLRSDCQSRAGRLYARLGFRAFEATPLTEHWQWDGPDCVPGAPTGSAVGGEPPREGQAVEERDRLKSAS